MIVWAWLVAGSVGSIGLLLIEAVSLSLRLTRVSLIYLVGTCFTSSRPRALLVGFVVYFALGLVFALAYVAMFSYWGPATWWRGGVLGLAHGSGLLLIAMPLLPEFHPRMANERYGPTAIKQLQPPGRLGLNYGPRTPIAVLLSHLAFGVLVGALYGGA